MRVRDWVRIWARMWFGDDAGFWECLALVALLVWGFILILACVIVAYAVIMALVNS